jgi:hypothetical protein
MTDYYYSDEDTMWLAHALNNSDRISTRLRSTQPTASTTTAAVTDTGETTVGSRFASVFKNFWKFIKELALWVYESIKSAFDKLTAKKTPPPPPTTTAPTTRS